MFYFDFQFTPAAVWLMSASLVFCIAFLWLYWVPLRRVTRHFRRQAAEETAGASVPASVVVFASDDGEELRKLLPVILGQDYPAPFEVIVVNEGQSDTTEAVVERLRLIHDNLYLTYTPDGARRLSRKKLALMIGIKAARYPVVVHTTAAAKIDSEKWLSRIMAPFSEEGVEVVLGYAHAEPEDDVKLGKRSRRFNMASDALAWLDAAITGKPYRGTELNLAYTRDAFFRNRGFSRSLNLKYGDDDIFINEIANGANTRVVLHPEAMVRRGDMHGVRSYRELRSRYFFTGNRVPAASRRRHACGLVCLWAFLLTAFAGGMVMWPNLLGLVIALVAMVAVMVLMMVSWRRAMTMLAGCSLTLTIPWFMLTRPFANAVGRARARLNRKYNYT